MTPAPSRMSAMTATAMIGKAPPDARSMVIPATIRSYVSSSPAGMLFRGNTTETTTCRPSSTVTYSTPTDSGSSYPARGYSRIASQRTPPSDVSVCGSAM